MEMAERAKVTIKGPWEPWFKVSRSAPASLK